MVGVLVVSACSSGAATGTGQQAVPTPPSTVPDVRPAVPDPANLSAGDPSLAAYTPTGPLIADSGFRPATDGYSFENYGQAPPGAAPRPNLTVDDVRKLFGDAVCGDVAAGKCDLTPPAQAWMTTTNKDMSGGHCYGFSVAAELLFMRKDTPSAYGADTTKALTIDDNPPLARQLAYTWAFQTLDSVNDSAIKGTPTEILAKLQAVLVPNAPETYTVSIFMRDGKGGHAVTPYAIEDRGNGTYSVLIYDNNYPGVTRQIAIDTNADTWRYEASTNPQEPSSVYDGDGATNRLELDPTTPGLGTQPCPFCGKVSPDGGAPTGAKGAAGGSAGSAPGATKPELDLIYLDASSTDHGHLLITDAAGHQLGYVGGNLVYTIPGARFTRTVSSKNWLDDIEPDYFVPDGGTYAITLDGSRMTQTDSSSFGIIGSSFDVGANDIQLEAGQVDTLLVGPSATKVSYTSNRGATPALSIGVSNQAADYTFDLATQGLSAGGTLNLGVPLDGSGLQLGITGSATDARVNLSLSRDDDKGQTDFAHNNIALLPTDTNLLQFGAWASATDPIPLLTTHNGTTTTASLANTH